MAIEVGATDTRSHTPRWGNLLRAGYTGSLIWLGTLILTPAAFSQAPTEDQIKAMEQEIQKKEAMQKDANARAAAKVRRKLEEEAAHKILEEQAARQREQEAQKTAEIDALLAQAEEDIKALRLTSPEANNAADKYAKVLGLDPVNERALAGKEAIAEKIVELLHGAIDNKNVSQAEILMKQVEELVPTDNIYRSAKARLAYYQQDYAGALQLAEPLAAEGDPVGQSVMGALYLEGKGVPQDNSKALAWYEKAAAQGLARAQYFIGDVYETGKYVPKDFSKAYTWYKKAAMQGFVFAQYNLANLYREGNGVSRDFAQAFEWYEKAALQGYPDAQSNLGAMYHNGMGVPKDFAKARLWYERAAAQGYELAKVNLQRLERDSR